MTLDTRELLQMESEHATWLDVVAELVTAGAGDINQGGKNERLHDAIVRWGEELAALRILAPQHSLNARMERERKWEQWTE